MSADAKIVQLVATDRNGGYLTRFEDNRICFWERPTDDRTTAEWFELAELYDGSRYQRNARAGSEPEDQSGSKNTKTSKPASQKSSELSFLQRWESLRQKRPQDFAVSSQELDSWERHEAARYEVHQDW